MRNLGLSLAIAALVAVLTATAGAAAPTSVSGSWAAGPLVPTALQLAGVNLKLTGDTPSAWTGDLAGTTDAFATFVIHPDGRVVAAPVRETFTGTVSRLGAGSLVFAEEAQGAPDGTVRIQATVIDGSGDLAAVRGTLVFIGSCQLDGACAGTYSGDLHR